MSQTAVEAPPPTAPQADGKSYIRHAKVIGSLTLVSRVLGLAREVVAGHYLGTGLVASAFTVAFTVPNLFRKLFGEGALSAAFIPLYAQALKAEKAPHAANQPSANDFAAASVNLLCVILLGITVIGELILIAWMLLEPGIRPDRMLTLRLTAIMLPYVLLICGTAFLSGIMQVHRRFGPPAFAPVLLNVCHIAVVLVGARLLGLHAHTAKANDVVDAVDAAHVAQLQTTLVYWLASFVLVSGVLQTLILLPGLRATGFRFKLVTHFWTPTVRKMLKLTIPVAMGAGVLQFSVLLDKGISTLLMKGVDSAGHVVDHFVLLGRSIKYPMEMGAPARLNLAQFLYQFPLGVFAIALATAIFPGLASDAFEKDSDRFRSVLRGGIQAALWEGIPASVGLILVRRPAVSLLFLHGQITPKDADLICQSVLYYSAAIWAFSVLQIVNGAYYSIHDTYTPLIMSIVNIVLNVIVEIPLLWWLGEAGMAVGTLVSFAIQAGIMLCLLDRKIGGLDLKKSVWPVIKMIIATGVMAAACLLVQRIPGYPNEETRFSWLVQLVVIMSVGATVYLAAGKLLGLDVTRQMFSKPGRKKT